MSSHVARLLAVLFAASASSFRLPRRREQAGELFSGFGAKSKDPIQVDAETLEVYEEGDQRISVFSGSVNVVRGNSTLKAAKLKLFSNKDSKADDDSAFTRIEASGSVYVNSKNQTVTGQSAVVDNKAQTITHGRQRRPDPGQERHRRRQAGDRPGDRARRPWCQTAGQAHPGHASRPTRRRARARTARRPATARTRRRRRRRSRHRRPLRSLDVSPTSERTPA